MFIITSFNMFYLKISVTKKQKLLIVVCFLIYFDLCTRFGEVRELRLLHLQLLELLGELRLLRLHRLRQQIELRLLLRHLAP